MSGESKEELKMIIIGLRMLNNAVTDDQFQLASKARGF
jgi:hypothetical protein